MNPGPEQEGNASERVEDIVRSCGGADIRVYSTSTNSVMKLMGISPKVQNSPLHLSMEIVIRETTEDWPFEAVFDYGEHEYRLCQ